MASPIRKEHIISFRIPKAQAEIVERMLKEHPISGVNSISQWFRKIGTDCVAGRISYKNPNDMLHVFDGG